MKMLSEGAESRVYNAKVMGNEAVVKLRHSKRYRIKELDENLRRTRTRKEARAMQRVAEAGVRVPTLFGLGKFSLYMEKVDGKLLKDVPHAGVNFARIGNSLAKMHNVDVVHGDFTPANIIVGKRGMCIIDFGLSDISDSIEDKALDLLLMKRAIDKECYNSVEAAYVKESGQARQVVSRLADIEKRGRYQVRTLT